MLALGHRSNDLLDEPSKRIGGVVSGKVPDSDKPLVRGKIPWDIEKGCNLPSIAWVSDDRGEVGLPRVGIEAVAANWEEHGLQVNVAFPDGKAYRLRCDAKAWPATDDRGRRTVLGAGPLSFRCVEPFHTWTMDFDGEARQTSTFDLVQGKKHGEIVEVHFQVKATMAVPPWTQGSLLPEARRLLEDKEISSFPAVQQAGVRYRWGGEETYGTLERSYPLDKIFNA